MPKYYPAFLNVDGQPCLVVGGGPIAERKVKTLVGSNARVTLISPQLTSRLKRRVDKGQITYLDRPYEQGDHRGQYLLIAATDDMKLNRNIGIEARADGVLVNVVDDPDYCDFIAPSIVQRGDITFAISTGGGSPALSRWLRTRLQSEYPSEYGKLAALLAQVRVQLRKEGRRITAARWQKSIDLDLVSLLKKGRKKEARERLVASLTNKKPSSRRRTQSEEARIE